MKFWLQHILAISILSLPVAESLYASSFELDTTTQYGYRLSPTLVIDLSEISTDNLFTKYPFRTSLLKRERNNDDQQFHFSNTPRFTLDLTNIDLLRLRGSNQLIRYIRPNSGGHTLSIINQDQGANTTSVIVHNDFIGIGINDSSRHFILGKESSDSEVTYSARWGSRF